MLVHLSFDAEDTDVVAGVLAEILGGTVVRPPSPPFDPRYRWVCCWDERGTIVELAPKGVVLAPGPAGEIVFLEEREQPRWSSNHALLLSKVPLMQIEKLAEAHGWQTGLVKNGRAFEVQNLWLENRHLVEFTTPELLPPYLNFFGPGNREHLDAQMRALEVKRTVESTDN